MFNSLWKDHLLTTNSEKAGTKSPARKKASETVTGAEKPARKTTAKPKAIAKPEAAAKPKAVAKVKAAPVADPATSIPELIAHLLGIIDDAKAEDIVTLDLAGKTSLADAMIVASGQSNRHVGAIAERILGSLREKKYRAPRVEGMPVCDWVLIDTGDIIIHLFRPEVRGFYNIEKLWGVGRPVEGAPPEVEDKPKRKAPVRRVSSEA